MLLLRPPGVYRAQSDTALLSEVLRRGGYARGRRALDVGCGAGALSLAAWRAGATSVTGVDVSMRSVAATWANARLRRAGVTVRRGDLLAPVRGQRFGLIVANPPYVPAASTVLPRYRMARCWDAGTDGRAILDRICAGAADLLAEDGTLLLVHSAVCGTEHTIQRLADGGLSGRVLDRGFVPFGPVMRARSALLEARGLMQPGQRVEELVVIGARHAG